ncbi:MAG TPA: alpha/beta hydrolase [Polyangiaceae bacterium]|nr:alpha/beta hydrolase [Polyangiaceae bacterium]
MRQELIPVTGGQLEVTSYGESIATADTLICASHPIDAFARQTTTLLANASGAAVICVNPRGVGRSSSSQGQSYELVQIIDDLEAVRRRLGVKRWVFWGMSGGGWLGLLYARRYPLSLGGVILESVCACLRERASDPECVLSPLFPAWREALAASALLEPLPSPAASYLRDQLEWTDGPGAGATLRRKAGPAVLVSPIPASATMRRMLPLLFELDTRAWLNSLTVPALVICGSADPVLPVRHAHALHDGLPNSEFVLVEGGGHVPVAESRPEVTTAVRAFLEQHRAATRSAMR